MGTARRSTLRLWLGIRSKLLRLLELASTAFGRTIPMAAPTGWGSLPDVGVAGEGGRGQELVRKEEDEKPMSII